MEDGSVLGGSNTKPVVLPADSLPNCSSQVAGPSLWISSSSPSFHGDSVSSSTSFVNFEDVRVGNPRDDLFSVPLDESEDGNEDHNGSFYCREKKRRFTADQVKFLERNFEAENKLEPQRKAQLAEELGLQPRQIAIWFQNRRARYKSKQLERDYTCLKTSYERLKNEYDGLLEEKERLRNEVHLLRNRLLPREKVINPNSEPTEPFAEPEKQISIAASEAKQEDASSARSDVLDSESPHCYAKQTQSFLFGPELPDFSHEKEDELTMSLYPPLYSPKLDEQCYTGAAESSFGQPYWFWP